MDETLSSLIRESIATYGAIITLVGIVVGLVLVMAWWFARPWIQKAAQRSFDKALETHKGNLNQTLATHQAELSATADSARAEYQRRLQELSLFSVDRHKAYAETFRILLVAEGALGELVGAARWWGDYSEARRSDLEAMLRENDVSKPVIHSVMDAWDADPDTAKIDEALDGARRIRAEGLRREFQNTHLANDLYFSPEVRVALEAAHTSLSSLSDLIRTSNGKNEEESEKKKREAQEAVVKVRERMQFDLQARNELVSNDD